MSSLCASLFTPTHVKMGDGSRFVFSENPSLENTHLASCFTDLLFLKSTPPNRL